MVLQKLWILQNSSQILWVSQSRFLVVMCTLQSQFLYKATLFHWRTFSTCVTLVLLQKAEGSLLILYMYIHVHRGH